MSLSSNNLTKFDPDDWNNLIRELDYATPIFYMMWKLGKPSFSEEIATAAVLFNKDGNCIGFHLNKEFWNKLDLIQKTFVISHECMHVILNHGLRMQNIMKDSGLVRCANAAMDIVVNNILAKNYFDKAKLGFLEKEGCWIETCFKPEENVEPDRNFEYYYNLLVNKHKDNPDGCNDTLDSHEGLEDKDAEWDKLKNFFNEVVEGCDQKEINKFVEAIKEEIGDEKSSKQRGTSPGMGFLKVSTEKIKEKKKWETVIKNWACRQIKQSTKDHEQWARINRRFVLVDKDLMIPSECEVDDFEQEKNKIDVWFFQDTSGSCEHLAPRFFKAAKSLPKTKFKVRMFCFDTSVYETSLESGKLYGFGGTSFSCIEEKIQEIIKKDKCKYPSAVFIITDGYGNNVSPQYPKKWH